MMKKFLRRNLRTIATVATTILVLWLVIRHVVGARNVRYALRDLNWMFLWLPLLITLISLSLTAVRWRLVLRAMGHSITFRRCLHSILAAWPVSAVTPSRAGDLLRAAYVKDSVPLVRGVSGVLAEKAIDLHSVCVFATLGALVAGIREVVFAGALVLIVAWILALLLLLRSRGRLTLLEKPIPKVVRRVLDAVSELFAHPVAFGAAIVTSLASVGTAIVLVYSLLVICGAQTHFGLVVALWPVAMLVGLVPVTLAGLGTRDAAFLQLLTMSAGQPFDEPAVLLSTLAYAFFTTWMLALVGLPLMARASKQNGDEQPENPDGNGECLND